MKIGIVSPFNPYTVIDYLSEESKLIVKVLNVSATSINVLVKSFLEDGHKVVVFTEDSSTFSNTKLYGEKIEIHIIGVKFKSKLLTYFPPQFITARRIENCIIKNGNNLDVLHAQWTYDFAFASSKFINKIPVICTVRDWAPFIYKSIPKVPIKLYFIQKLFWKQKMIISKKVINNSNIQFIANSKYTQQRIHSIKPEYYVPIIFNSIEDSYILRKRDNYPQQHTFISISPSIDDKRKNYDLLIQAFSLLLNYYPEAKLIMIGNIHYDRYLYKKWVKKNMLKNVDFIGFIDHVRLMAILDEVTCLVHPALEETFGNIFLEGMARRVPVIGGKSSGAVPFVLKHGQCGCLCDVTNPKSITDAMIKIIEDPAYTKSIIDNATSVLLNEYAGSVVAQNHLGLYMSKKKHISCNSFL
jgi:glycosyltransferase involved in cell wall biosynthesis